MLSLRLLGPAAILRDGQDISNQIKYRKGLALLAVLAVSVEQWHGRSGLAQLLWPQLESSAALTNLRQVLGNLTALLNEGSPPGQGLLRCERERIGLFSPPGLRAEAWLDLAGLHPPSGRAGSGDPLAEDWLLQHFEPWSRQPRGPLLQGLRLQVGQAFDSWLQQTRAGLQARRLQALQQLCVCQVAAGRDAAAVLSARQLVQADPLDEAACAQLMRLLLRCGDRRGAQTALHELEHQLMAQIGTKPGRATRELLLAPGAGSGPEWPPATNGMAAAGGAGGPGRPDAVTAAIAATAAASPRAQAGQDAEMRWLTLLYLDFPDAGLDTDASALLLSLRLAQATLARWGGLAYPAQGQGLHACFGIDHQQEHGALRAALAVRALQQELAGTQAQANEETPQRLRAGIVAGMVLCAPAATPATPPDMAGPLPGLALSLCQRAQPGQVLLGGEIGSQLHGHFSQFALQEQAPLERPGQKPWPVAELRTPATPGRQALAGAAPRTDWVGRSQELALLGEHWRRARAGQPQWLLLRGEAGIGKTGLARMFTRQVLEQAEGRRSGRGAGGQPVLLSWWPCRLEYQHQPLAPLRAALTRQCGILSTDGPEQILERLRDGLHAWWPALARGRGRGLQGTLPAEAESAALLQPLVRLFDPETLSGGANKNELFAALFQLLDQLSAQQAVLLVVDDLHWSDQSTRELLARCAGLFDRQRLMLLLTTRPDVGILHAGTDPLTLDLGPLPEADSALLVGSQDRLSQLTPEQRAGIAAACGGIPLFIERQTRSLLDGKQDHLVPVKELLQAELSRLGPFAPVLQMAAVLGQHFDAGLLARLMPEFEVDAVLQLAGQLNLLECPQDRGREHAATGGADGRLPGSPAGAMAAPASGGLRTHAFRHALIRDAAYASLPTSARRGLHLRVAQTLQEQPELAAGELARHFEAAEHWSEASSYWQVAGRQARAHQFAGDALNHFERALALRQGAPAEELRGLRFELAHAALQSQGYGSALAHQQYRLVFESLDGRALSEQEAQDRFLALSGMYWGAASQGRNDGLLVADRLEALAQGPTQRLMACFAQGNSLFWAGQLDRAMAYQQEGVALAGQLSEAQRCTYTEDDLGVLLRAFQAWNHGLLGQAEQGRRVAAEGIALARAGRKAHALCFVLSFAAGLSWTEGDVEALGRHAGEGQALGTRLGFPLWQAVNQLFGMAALVRSGALRDPAPVLQAAEMMRQAYQAGTATARWVVIGSLLDLGQIDAAEPLLRLSLDEAAAFGDHYCRADLLRMLGQCLLARGDSAGAEQQFQAARELARQQGALGLLARLPPAAARTPSKVES